MESYKRLNPQRIKLLKMMKEAGEDVSLLSNSKDQGGPKISFPPSILFIEIDFVSKAHASRHLPLTSNLLRDDSINSTNINKELKHECLNGLCTFIFEKATIVGGDSLPNQISEHSGCTFLTNSSSYFLDECGFDEVPFTADDKWLRGGEFFGNVSQSCRPCPFSFLLRDPLKLCYTGPNVDATKNCCVQDTSKNKRVCHSKGSTIDGLQLLKRRRGVIFGVLRILVLVFQVHLYLMRPELLDMSHFWQVFCYPNLPYVAQNCTVQ